MNEKLKKFISPLAEIYSLGVSDIVTTSLVDKGTESNGDGWGVPGTDFDDWGW